MRMRTTLAAVCCLNVIFVHRVLQSLLLSTKLLSTSQCGQEIVIVNDQHLMETLEKVKQLLPLPGPSSQKYLSSMTNHLPLQNRSRQPTVQLSILQLLIVHLHPRSSLLLVWRKDVEEREAG